jgi:hypothetical protein
MPTPFTHLEIAQRLLRDPKLPRRHRNDLLLEKGAFLLGNIAADARVDSGAPRLSTHFYHYGTGISVHPWRAMIDQYPALMSPQSPAHRAFVAGYVAHLSVDEIWALQMVGPHIAMGDWGDNVNFRFFILHLLLITMDERDFAQLEPWQSAHLKQARPRQWTPFLSDHDLGHWQGVIAEQIKPGGKSLTLPILGERIGRTPEELRQLLDSRQYMQDNVWEHTPPTFLAETEAEMVAHARQQLLVYMTETAL